ncbi:MAG: pyridoxamine 5-phosphate oxidase [Bacteroidota bacterium]|jgi:pyridoxamine 5'-phosphate oxidase
MLQDMRVEYGQGAFDKGDLDGHPVVQFERWFREAVAAGVEEPNAMTLATASADGYPSARVVLLKDYRPEGFTFFTNYDSRKGEELRENARAALVFFWAALQRQVRIEGTVGMLLREESVRYFQRRPRGSQLGAWASPQSKEVPDRQFLLDRWKAMESTFEGQEVLPAPPHWGGYLVMPHTVEFWQGQAGRMHDRLCYRRSSEGGWTVVRLAP